MLPTEYLMLTYIIHIDKKEASNFVISTNISIFIVLKNSFLSPHRQQILRLLGNKKRGFASYSKLEKKQTLFVYDAVQMISRMV